MILICRRGRVQVDRGRRRQPRPVAWDVETTRGRPWESEDGASVLAWWPGLRGREARGARGMGYEEVRCPGRRAQGFTLHASPVIENQESRFEDSRFATRGRGRDTVPARGKNTDPTRRGRWPPGKAAEPWARLGGGSLVSWCPCSACLDQVSEREEEGKVRYSRHRRKAQAQAQAQASTPARQHARAHAHAHRQGRLAGAAPSDLYVPAQGEE